MMSGQNRLSAIPDHGTGIFPPHLMFYAPNMTTKDIGFDTQPKLDYLGMTHPGAGDNLIVVVPMASTSPASPGGRGNRMRAGPASYVEKAQYRIKDITRI
jgi:hypothetical protein